MNNTPFQGTLLNAALAASSAATMPPQTRQERLHARAQQGEAEYQGRAASLVGTLSRVLGQAFTLADVMPMVLTTVAPPIKVPVVNIEGRKVGLGVAEVTALPTVLDSLSLLQPPRLGRRSEYAWEDFDSLETLGTLLKDGQYIPKAV